MTAPPPPVDGRGGRRVLLVLAVVALLALGTCTYLVASSPRARGVFEAGAAVIEAGVEAANAPGTEALRAAGCEEAMVLDGRALAGALAKIEQDPGRSQADGVPPKLVMCQFSFDAPELSCGELAVVYANAVDDPPDEIGVAIRVKLPRREICRGVFAADGRWLRDTSGEETGALAATPSAEAAPAGAAAGGERTAIGGERDAATAAGEPAPLDFDTELRTAITRDVGMGFMTEADIIAVEVEAFAEARPGEDLRPLVARLTRQLLLAHRRAQRTWPSPTDCERLDAAFAALEAEGILARQDYEDCQTCGHAAARRELAAAGERTRGYVFYHQQDTESAYDTGELYLAYGAAAEACEGSQCEPERALVAIGNAVVAALRAQGLTVSWNGSGDTRILVSGLTWRRRR